jgi:hypothetical protein
MIVGIRTRDLRKIYNSSPPFAAGTVKRNDDGTVQLSAVAFLVVLSVAGGTAPPACPVVVEATHDAE